MRNKCKNIYKIKRELVDEKGKTRSTIETWANKGLRKMFANWISSKYEQCNVKSKYTEGNAHKYIDRWATHRQV